MSGEFERMQQRAAEIDDIYRPDEKTWDTREYVAGMTGDLGDLTKLLQARAGLRQRDNVEAGIRHEIHDLLWSILRVCDEEGITVDSYMQAMDELEERLTGEENEV